MQADRVYTDHGISGTHRARSGLREALAACRPGNLLVVTKLDRLAPSKPDARDIVDELTARGVRLNPGGSMTRPTRSPGCCSPSCPIAEFEADPARVRTLEGMAVAKARLRGEQPRLKPSRTPGSSRSWQAGNHTTLDLAEMFDVARSTVYRAIQRAQASAAQQRQARSRRTGADRGS